MPFDNRARGRQVVFGVVFGLGPRRGTRSRISSERASASPISANTSEMAMGALSTACLSRPLEEAENSLSLLRSRAGGRSQLPTTVPSTGEGVPSPSAGRTESGANGRRTVNTAPPSGASAASTVP